MRIHVAHSILCVRACIIEYVFVRENDLYRTFVIREGKRKSVVSSRVNLDLKILNNYTIRRIPRTPER